MTQQSTATRSYGTVVRTPPEPLRHLVCPCQDSQQAGKAHCGVAVKPGPGVPRSRFKPIQICVICQDHTEAHTPCKHCGRTAR